MTNTTKSKGGVQQRRKNALSRLEKQLAKGEKVATNYGTDGKKYKTMVPLEGKDKLRITNEMQSIKSKFTSVN